MRGLLTNMKNPHGVLGGPTVQRPHPEIGVVFVIDRVEVTAFDQVDEVRKFEAQKAVWGDQVLSCP